MLHTQTVAPQTLGLLKQLEAEPRLAAFNLAGGTALALYLGHRVSVDLDLFTPESFDAGELEAFLSQRYGFQTAFRRPDTLKGMIDGVKIGIETGMGPTRINTILQSAFFEHRGYRRHEAVCDSRRRFAAQRFRRYRLSVHPHPVL